MDLEGIGYNSAWKSVQPQTGCTCADHYSTFPNILESCGLRFNFKILMKTMLKNNQATKISFAFLSPPQLILSFILCLLRQERKDRHLLMINIFVVKMFVFHFQSFSCFLEWLQERFGTFPSFSLSIRKIRIRILTYFSSQIKFPFCL